MHGLVHEFWFMNFGIQYKGPIDQNHTESIEFVAHIDIIKGY